MMSTRVHGAGVEKPWFIDESTGAAGLLGGVPPWFYAVGPDEMKTFCGEDFQIPTLSG